MASFKKLNTYCNKVNLHAIIKQLYIKIVGCVPTIDNTQELINDQSSPPIFFSYANKR